MPKGRRSKPKSQHEKFVQLARESGASGSEDEFVSKLRKIAPSKPGKSKPPHTTNFGLWSAAKLKAVTRMLRKLGVSFEIFEERADQKLLEHWCAWDPNAADPYLGYNLWIRTDDLEKVGYKIVEAFPERKFGAP